MSGVQITWRALTQWPAGRPRTPEGDRENARFKSPGYWSGDVTQGTRKYVAQRSIPLTQTLNELDRELWNIGVLECVVQVDVARGDADIRRDGQVRADARVNTPAVVLTFTRDRVAHVFACDQFKTWQDNLRGIVLGLEGLRRLERYGIVQAGEQYRGWQALPASTSPALSTAQSASVVARHTGGAWNPADILRDREITKRAIRAALAKTHPDAGGSTADFQLVQEAKRVLEAHYGGAL